MSERDESGDTATPAARFCRGLVRFRWLLLGLAVLLVLLAYFPAQRLDFDRSIESMFRPSDPLLPPYRQLERTFSGDDLVLVAYVDAQLMTPAGIERVRRLTDRLATIEGITAVLSLTTTPLGTDIITDTDRGPAYLDLFESFHIGPDGKTTAIACILDTAVNSVRQVEIIDSIRDHAQTLVPEAVLIGGPVMMTEGFRLVEQDGHYLGWLSSVLLGLTILLCFRSVRWVVVPLVVVNATLLLTEAVLVLTRLRLSIVSSMLWSIVTVVGIATVIHLLVRFREERQNGHSAKSALLIAGTALATPIMWTCLTDAAGFASLLAAEVGPVRDFGLMMVFGSLLAMLSLALFLPGLILWGQRDVDPHWAWGESALGAFLRTLIDVVIRRPIAILCCSVALVLLAGWGCFRLDVETDFTKNFRASSRIVQSYSLVESNLGGAGDWDIIVPAPPPERLDTRYLARLRALENSLRETVIVIRDDGQPAPGLTKVLGLVDAFDTVPTPRFLVGDVLVRMKHRKIKEQMPAVAELLYAEDTQQPGQYFSRIMLRSLERQSSAQKRQLISQVTHISEAYFPADGDQPAAQVTGFFVLLANLIDSMIHDQWVTLSIALVAIGAMMTIALRSPVLAAIALVPNILPVLFVMGLMGWLGIKINMGAAMIAAVSVGLSIDAEIHYLTAFKRMRQAGRSVRESLYSVQQSVGRAVVFSTLALTVGFGALCVSDFIPTVYFGGLVSLSILGGVAGNLMILPLLIHLFVPETAAAATDQAGAISEHSSEA